MNIRVLHGMGRQQRNCMALRRGHEGMLASRQLAFAKARALAEAAAQHAIIELLAPNRVQAWPINGTIITINIDGHDIGVAVRDATGLVDLNAASADLLAAAFAATGGDEGWRQEIVDAILDWRDGDKLRHLNGAEDDDYLAAGHDWTARDGAFASIDELRYVLGMRQEVFDKLAPFLTVYSGRSAVNLEYAPPFLIAALTGEYLDPVAPPAPSGAETAQMPTRIGGARNGTYHVYVNAPGAAGVTGRGPIPRGSETARQVHRAAHAWLRQFLVMVERRVNRATTGKPQGGHCTT